MATFSHVKPTSKWKKVKIAPDILAKGDFDGLMDLQVLDDYNLIDSTGKSSSKNDRKQNSGKKKGKKENVEVDAIRNVSSIQDGGKSNIPQKKKRKKNKKKKLKHDTGGDIPCVQNSEVIDVFEAIQSQEGQNAKKQDKHKVQKTKKKQKRKSDEMQVPSELTVPPKKAKLTIHDSTEKLAKGMEAWKEMFVPQEVLKALKEQGFYEPTPIQAQVLPHAIRDRLDIVGAAETGSGKTLAFGIPLIHHIQEYKAKEDSHLDPTFEGQLTEMDELQDSDESSEENNQPLYYSDDSDEESLQWDDDEEAWDSEMEEEEGEEEEAVESEDEFEESAGNSSNEDSEPEDEKNFNQGSDSLCVKVVDNVDFTWLEEDPNSSNLAQPVRPPLALILEPTRELAIQVRDHLKAATKYTDIQVVAIVGGLALQKQQRLLKRCPEIVVATPGRLWELIQEGEPFLSHVVDVRNLVVDEADRMVEKGHFEELSKLLEHINLDEKKRKRRHNYVFSATLTMIHQGPKRVMKKKKIKLDEKQKLEMLIQSIGLKDRPKVIDLTQKTGTSATLTEARINCTVQEKDYYLYYFLKHHPGRTLVFTNSKDCIRRLVSIFTLLKCQPLPLHADMHQRQRLKNLEKFTANEKGLLLASDVAARGLDIPNVQHVIHYQVPHTVENYVHRSGRTARARKEGLSVMIIGPDDVKNYKKIVHTLNRNEDLPAFPVEYQKFPEVKSRVGLARQIDVKEYRFSKKKHQNSWFEKAAKEMDIELDEELLNDLGDTHEQTMHKLEIKQLKMELDSILKQPFKPTHFSGKYPTKMGKLQTLQRSDCDADAIQRVKKEKRSNKDLAVMDNSSHKGKQRNKQKWKKKFGKNKGK